jgi:hypothetical protein
MAMSLKVICRIVQNDYSPGDCRLKRFFQKTCARKMSDPAGAFEILPGKGFPLREFMNPEFGYL